MNKCLVCDAALLDTEQAPESWPMTALCPMCRMTISTLIEWHWQANGPQFSRLIEQTEAVMQLVRREVAG